MITPGQLAEVFRDLLPRLVLGGARRSPAPQRCQNRCCLPLPTEALIDLKVRRRLSRFIPVWGWLNGFTVLRITVIPQRWPACRGDARRLCLCPDVFQYLPDVGAVRDEGDDAHLPATQGAQQREHFVDSGHQHRPQVAHQSSDDGACAGEE